MRVVIDTNVVFVGACIGVGACNGVVKACLVHQVVPLMGTTLLVVCEWTQVYFLWRPNLADESDNHLLALAVAGAADAVVTRNVRDLHNKQLLFPALRLLTPEEFLKEL